MKILSHGEHKELDGSKEDWDNAMQFFNSETRSFLANAAAHGNSIVEIDEGHLLMVNEYDHDYTKVWRVDNSEFTNYYEVDTETIVKYEALVIKLLKKTR